MNYNSRNTSRRFSRKKFLLLFAAFCGLTAFISHRYFNDDRKSEVTEELVAGDEEDISAADSAAEDSMFQLIKKNHVQGVRSFTLDFPDDNGIQLEAARKNGVIPLESHSEIDNYLQTGRLVYIGNSPYFHLDDLTHSMPYLTPKAYHLVNTICLNYLDSLQSKGMPPHLLIVTSVLRTKEDITKLRQRNRNSVEQSAHRYGTTVDITYNRFMPLTPSGSLSDEPTRYDFKQKLVLAEVLRDLRHQDQCYVKYERRQACFHLTVR